MIWKTQSGRRINQFWSYGWRSFGLAQVWWWRTNRLKRKRLLSTRQITFWLIENVRDINVILLRLRLVPINRWTVTLYCSHWLVIARSSLLDFCLLSSWRYKCNSILLMFVHDYIIIMWIIWWLDTIIHVSFYISIYILTYCNDEGMSFMIFVWGSLYPKGNNDSKDEGL
jgi:hypothetical protein